jgi:hypothetical protein
MNPQDRREMDDSPRSNSFALCDPSDLILEVCRFVQIGWTNMTALAFSGLGLNPHYGTRSIHTIAATAEFRADRHRTQRCPSATGWRLAFRR